VFFLYEVIPITKEKDWMKKLLTVQKKDIYYHNAYCKLYEEVGVPYLFIYYTKQGSNICYTFFKRKIDLPFLSTKDSEPQLYDITTAPYSYGGPLYEENSKENLINFRKSFEEYCKKENIITEFIRFHPVLKNHRLLDGCMEINYDRETIMIDLTKDNEEIYQQYHKNHKRNIKKAIKNGLSFKVFVGKDALTKIKPFYNLYKQTMDKLNADPYYYFSENYIEHILSQLNSKSFIAAVYDGEKMVSASLCFHDGGILHYHLGCSDKDYLHLGTNVFLLHNIALWGKQQNCNTFHLGGGHVGRDSLFQFKYRFNTSGTLPFYIGKKIHNKQTYKELVMEWEKHYKEQHPASFFPAYRKKLNE
jgi:lipid II:glycine glycyltransferase (peptidoglycan interpeptide bridge formation enzyme)